MNRNIIKTKQLELAEIRQFNLERKSSIIPEERAYAILEKVDDQYFNLFNPSIIYPVYGRVPYSNTTMDGEDFGTMISLVSGEIQDGPCYVLDGSMRNILQKEHVFMEELVEFVLYSGKFFPDRITLIENMDFFSRIKFRKRYLLDKQKEEKLKDYLGVRNQIKQKIK